jgi:hypothetical protein
MKGIAIPAAVIIVINLSAQDKPYYYQIPDTPAVYTAATVAARLVDGLGFRYFWATEGLTEKDLSFKPSKDARTTLETIEHIKGLSDILFNTVNKKPTEFTVPSSNLSFAELRTQTLKNIQAASELLKQPGANPAELDMIFQRANGNQE